MSLKHRKLLSLACCVFAAVFLAAGSVLLRFYSEMEQYRPGWGADTTEAAEGTTMIVDSTFLPETTQGITAAETEPAPQEAGRWFPVQRFGSILLIVIGAFLAVWFAFFSRQERLWLGPESNLFLAICAAAVLLPVPYRELWIQFAAAFAGWLLLSISLRGLWTWVREKLPLRQTDVHRLGMRVAAGHWNRYVLFQLFWTLVFLTCGVWLLAAGEFTFPAAAFAAVCFAAVLLSLCCRLRLAWDGSRLIDQITLLRQEGEITVGSGLLHETEQQLMELRDQRDTAVRTAVANERFKVELISNVSHDLRTPLSAILGYGELLEQEELSPTGREHLRRLNQKAGYMRDLVESLFELTKVSSGAAELRREEIDLIRLVEQTLGLFDDRLQERELRICRHYFADRAPLCTDGARMHQVFANLIGNAVKYTLPGTRIHIEMKKEGAGYTVRITNIASYEMNFDPEEILQRFTRGDKMRTTEGSGIGLAIAKTYTESVGGSFSVTVDGEQFSAIVTLPEN